MAVDSSERASTSASTSAPPLPTPTSPTRTASRAHEHKSGNWREEHALMQHQLRQAKAEIAQLRAKIGIQNNAAPFGSTSPRQSLGSPTNESFGPTPRRRSPSPFDSLSNGSPRSLDGQAVLSASPRRSSNSSSAANGHGPLGGVPGSVAMNRALISNEGSGTAVETLLSVPGEEPPTAVPGNEPNAANLAVPETDGLLLSSLTSSRPTSPDPSSSSASIPTLHPSGLPQPASRPRSPLPSSNPFFGSSATTRERLSKSAASAQSGSGKVISGLQSDLLQARSALETTRGQLRLSQRAVEHLGRQTEDLRETKERLSAEIEALNRQLSRKERLQEEALTRARSAEATLTVVQKELAELKASVKGRMKELEAGAKKAEELKVKAEREYASLRDGMRTMQNGWRDDLRWLKDDVQRTQREMETKNTTCEFAKVLSDRTNLASSLSSDLASLKAVHSTFAEQHAASSGSALKQLGLLTSRTEQDRQRADALRDEFTRLRRSMVEYQADAGPTINSDSGV